ncbi:hypothetical protein BKA70DRAFT_1445575 [Coprinopsis sp. MPI-PUGE-AT-0042]|nr:hypothetical protein BKA70DRAFT_1445575 [Coprinopsis sp. MPI-PUGE-AT-0042]
MPSDGNNRHLLALSISHPRTDDVRDRLHPEEQVTPPDRCPADQYPNWPPPPRQRVTSRTLPLEDAGTWKDEEQEEIGAGVKDPANPCTMPSLAKMVKYNTRLIPQHPPSLPANPDFQPTPLNAFIDYGRPIYKGSRLLHLAKAEQRYTNQSSAMLLVTPASVGSCYERTRSGAVEDNTAGMGNLVANAVFKAFLPTLLESRKTLESEFSSTSHKGHETCFWDVVVIGGCPGAIYTPSLGSQSTRWLSDQVTSRSTLVNRGSTLIIVSFCMISTMVSIMSAVCASAAGIGLRREHQCGRCFVARTQIIATLRWNGCSETRRDPPND